VFAATGARFRTVIFNGFRSDLGESWPLGFREIDEDTGTDC